MDALGSDATPGSALGRRVADDVVATIHSEPGERDAVYGLQNVAVKAPLLARQLLVQAQTLSHLYFLLWDQNKDQKLVLSELPKEFSFRGWDKDKSGAIDKAELKAFMTRATAESRRKQLEDGMKRAERIMAAADTNKNGFLSLKEYEANYSAAFIPVISEALQMKPSFNAKDPESVKQIRKTFAQFAIKNGTALTQEGAAQVVEYTSFNFQVFFIGLAVTLSQATPPAPSAGPAKPKP